MTISDLTIEHGNATANTSGGGILNGGTLTLDAVTLAGNAASGSGGGIENLGTLTIVDSTIASNTASQNGGGIDTSGPLAVQSSTIANNQAAIAGGLDVESGTTTLLDVIVAGDTVTTKDPDIAGTVSSLGHNLIGYVNSDASGLVSSDLTGLSPVLGPLQNNGGPTPTLALLAVEPGHRRRRRDRRSGDRPARPAAGGQRGHRHRRRTSSSLFHPWPQPAAPTSSARASRSR